MIKTAAKSPVASLNEPPRSALAGVCVVLAIGLFHALAQAALIGAAHRAGIPWRAMYRDPNAIADQPYYFGWWSTIGGTLFVVAGSLAVFTHVALPSHARTSSRFLLHGGLLSLVLGADDLLMLHDGLLASLGIPEVGTFALYALATAAWLWSGRSKILQNDGLGSLCLGAALAALAFSALVDVGGGPLILEDSSKQTGILLWAIFFWRGARRLLGRAQVQTASSAGDDATRSTRFGRLDATAGVDAPSHRPGVEPSKAA